jgi:periplasmic protein TonB
MNDHFFLPVCFAAAAHGALFFGFTKHPRATPPHKESTVLTQFLVDPVIEEPLTIETSETVDARPKATPDLPTPPRSPEPEIATHWAGPTMEPPSVSHVGELDSREMRVPVGLADRGETISGQINGVISSDLLDNTPRARFQAAPIYPFEAKRTGTQGEVHVEFEVDELGRVIAPRVVHSSNRIFEEATLRAVAKWRFEPGRRHGEAVKFRMTVPVMFNLNES